MQGAQERSEKEAQREQRFRRRPIRGERGRCVEGKKKEGARMWGFRTGRWCLGGGLFGTGRCPRQKPGKAVGHAGGPGPSCPSPIAAAEAAAAAAGLKACRMGEHPQPGPDRQGRPVGGPRPHLAVLHHLDSHHCLLWLVKVVPGKHLFALGILKQLLHAAKVVGAVFGCEGHRIPQRDLGNVQGRGHQVAAVLQRQAGGWARNREEEVHGPGVAPFQTPGT